MSALAIMNAITNDEATRKYERRGKQLVTKCFMGAHLDLDPHVCRARGDPMRHTPPPRASSTKPLKIGLTSLTAHTRNQDERLDNALVRSQQLTTDLLTMSVSLSDKLRISAW